jgi:poly(A) polymerase
VDQEDKLLQLEAPAPEPTIIPRAQHTLSRKNIDPDALKVLYRLHNHGFLAYLVGGSVRDVLLGRRPKDFDVGTDARPNQVHRLFRNSRVIGRRFRLVQVFFRGGKVVEVSTFRRSADVDNGEDEVLQANNTFGTPAEDALRRDLTINALFYNIADYSLVDYVDGLKDLKSGLIRSVGDADLRFHRDPVRVLRAVRHAARTGFKLTDDTFKAVGRRRGELSLCPQSRVRDELMRDLKGGSAAAWLELAHQTGVLYSLLPSLEPYYGPEDSELRLAAGKLLKRVDALIAKGIPPSDPVIVAALFWPALEEKSAEMEFPPGRAGHSRWAFFVRDVLPQMAKSVQFAKRVMERACQIGGVMGFLREEHPPHRLPKKVTEKGYFADACQLAEVLGRDLASRAGKASSKSTRKRRRRRRKKRPNTGANTPS